MNDGKGDLQADTGEDVPSTCGAPEVVEAKTEASLLRRNMYWKALLGLIAFNHVFRKHMSSILT